MSVIRKLSHRSAREMRNPGVLEENVLKKFIHGFGPPDDWGAPHSLFSDAKDTPWQRRPWPRWRNSTEREVSIEDARG